MREQIPEIVKMLGGRMVFGPKTPETWEDLISTVHQGLPCSSVEQFALWLKISETEVLLNLGGSQRTFFRWKSAHKRLSMTMSDILLRIARLYEYATEVFGDKDAATRWMETPNKSLSGVTPRSLLKTDIGAKQVELVLGRIEHGIFA